MENRQIIVSGIYVFSDDNVLSVSTVENESILGSELSYDTLTANVRCEQSIDIDAFKALPYGTDVSFTLGNSVDALFFLDKMKRVAERDFELECISFVGLLDKQKHSGGIYKGTAFSSVLAGILGGTVSGTSIYNGSTVIAHIPNLALDSTKIYGWLPYDTRRSNLRRLLLAVNAHIFKNASTKRPSFEPLSGTSAGSITSAKLYIDYTEEVPQIASKIVVTEHSYFYDPRSDAVELFNNSSGYTVTNHTVVFSQAPIYRSTVVAEGGLRILSCHENYAVVSGRGILKGVPYIHSTFDVTRTNSQASTDYEVSLTDDGLISIANSELVADRLLEYYTAKNKISTDIVYSGEKCGGRYSFVNRYGETIFGYLSKMNKTISSFVKAACEFVTGYAGTDYGNNYDTVVKLTGTGTWTKPAGVTRFRVVLIGAGSGGYSGYKGEDGSTSGSGGNGGSGGAGGAAGRIFERTFDTASASTSYTYVCASGGAGGSASCPITKDAGTFSTETSYKKGEMVLYSSTYYVFTADHDAGAWDSSQVSSLGTQANVAYFGKTGGASRITVGGTMYTSNSGYVTDHGFIDLFNDILYAVPGVDGMDGGDGGDAGATEEGTASDKTKGSNGKDIEFEGVTYKGGSGSNALVINPPMWSAIKRITGNGRYLSNFGFSLKVAIGGGGGSGAAVGTNGSNGGTGWASSILSAVLNDTQDEKYSLNDEGFRAQEYIEHTGGMGAAGVMPTARTQSGTEGSGGDGGHGGSGAGGNSATSSASASIAWYKSDFCEVVNFYLQFPTAQLGSPVVYNSSNTYNHGDIIWYSNQWAIYLTPYNVYQFNTSTNYFTGDAVRYGTTYYIFTQDHTAGAWNSSHVRTASTSELPRAYYILNGSLYYVNSAGGYPLLNSYFTWRDDLQLYKCISNTTYSSFADFQLIKIGDIRSDSIAKKPLAAPAGGYGGAGASGADGCILIYYKA